MSPGIGGAMVTSPGRSAVKVLTKKLSPPRTERRRPPKMPPRVPVSILMSSDILTMAPDSAWSCSRWSSLTRAKVKAGLFSSS